MKLILSSEIGNNGRPIFGFCGIGATDDKCNIELNFSSKTVSVEELKNELNKKLPRKLNAYWMSINKDKNIDSQGIIPFKVFKKRDGNDVINLTSELKYLDLFDIDESYLIEFFPNAQDIVKLVISPNEKNIINILKNSRNISTASSKNKVDMRFLKKFEISPGEYLKNELDNNFRKQVDNLSKLFYKLGFTNELYSVLDRDNMIEFDETDNVRVKDLPEDYVSRTLVPAIKKYNREFSRELLLSAYSGYLDTPEVIPDIVKQQLLKIGKSKVDEGDALIKPQVHSKPLIDISKANIPMLISAQQGGNKIDYRKVRNILELVAEPKHDFGKGPTSRAAAISHKINTEYDGSISGEKKSIQNVKDSLRKKGFFGKIFNNGLNFNQLLTGSHEAKLLHTLSFIKKYHIDIDESTAKGKLTQLHSFFRFYKYIDNSEFIESSSNQAGQLTEMNFKDLFKRVFKANVSSLGIKHFVFDTGAGIDFLGSTGGVKDELKKESEGLNAGEILDAINLIVPLVNIWDPATASINNFNCDVLKAYAVKDEKFMELLKTTYLENNTESTNDIWFPKRDTISKYYSVKYNEEHKLSCTTKTSTSPPLTLIIKTRAEEIENLSPGEYTEINLMGGFSVDNLSRAMKCIIDDGANISKLKAVEKSTKAQTDADTQSLRKLVTALMTIQFDDYEPSATSKDDILINDLGKVVENDKNKLRVRILLDMKKSGDWGQVKWVRRINKSFPKAHKTMFISGDNLCALMGILNGVPTIFGSTGMEKLESGGHVSAKLLSFYSGSPSKLTINEVTQFQVYVDNQLGVEFLTPQHTLKLFSDIKESLKEKYPIFRLESFNTPLRVMINDAKSDYSSMPDFLLYKLTSESEPDISEPSERIIDKSVFELLFDDESNIIRKHLFDISSFKMQLAKVNEGSIPESEVDKLEPTILNQIGIIKGLISVIKSSNDFIKADYNDIALKTDNIARCINVINSDLIYGDSGGTSKTISKPHVDEINKLCGIKMEYGDSARASIVQRRTLQADVSSFKKTFTLELADKLEHASRLISEDAEEIPIKEMTIEQIEQVRTRNFCDEVYGKPTTRHWFRSSEKILTLMQNMSSIMSKVLEVGAMNDIYVRLVSMYNNITGVLSDINLFSEITPENETDTMWIKNVLISSIETGYYKLLGIETSEEDGPRPSEKIAEDEEKEAEINSIQINLAQITTNIECLLVGMNKFSSVIMSQLGNKREMKNIFNSYVEVLESQETTFAEMFKMFDDIRGRGFIQTMNKSFTKELNERTTAEEEIIDESHMPLVEEMASDESVQLRDIANLQTINTGTEELIETSDKEIPTINTPERNIIMQLKFEDSSKSKYRIYKDMRVKLLRQPPKRTGMYRVQLIDGPDAGKIIILKGDYVFDLDEYSVPAEPPAAPLPSSDFPSSIIAAPIEDEPIELKIEPVSELEPEPQAVSIASRLRSRSKFE